MRIIDAIKAVGLIDGVRGYMYTTKARKAQIKQVESYLKANKARKANDVKLTRIFK
jgi:hypothetical protein